MMAKTEVELFRFDSRTDYLPYYTKHSVSYSSDETIADLFEKINLIQPFGFDKEGVCKINHYFLRSSERIADVISRCGETLTIGPASEFLVYKDLQIDKSDLASKLDLLAPYMSQEEKESCLKRTELHYYASNTLNYKRDYIGDHVLLCAAEIIEKHPENEKEILRLLSDKDNGVWYHSSLKNRLFSYDSAEEATIEQLLKKCLKMLKPEPKSKIGKKIRDFFQKESPLPAEGTNRQSEEISVQESRDFAGFNIATYEGTEPGTIESLVEKSGAVHINIPSKHEDMTPYSQHVDKNFSCMIAGDILLQAMDKNADFILVKNEKMRDFFDKNQAKM
ncbi:MAG: DUF5644 domain-containing protein [Campylobacterales bacterium]|nr:DUF5644 domain-containing protein [Campylobacterales bacterium]